MTNHGRLTLHEGVIGARVEPLAHMDAAVSGEMAGIELSLGVTDVHIGPRTDYRGDLTLSLSMHPDTMAALRDKLAITLPGPAFTDPEWRAIQFHLNFSAAQHFDGMRPREEARKLADRIDEGLNAR